MKRAAYIILATIALCSCNTSDEGSQLSESALDEIIISPTLSDQVSTKGTIIEDDTDLQKETFMLYATAYDNDTAADYAVAKAEIGYSYSFWSPTEGHKIYWPTSESDVTFYAWHPATVEPAYIGGKELYFACDTKAAPKTSDNITLYKDTASGDVVHYYNGAAGVQEDLICSTTTMKNPTQQSVEGYDKIDYEVDLAFVHALTHLKFQYKTAAGVEVRIKAMTLHNIISKGGFYSYSDGTYEWAYYDSDNPDYAYNYYEDTRPNYHCVPMAWGNEEFVASTETAVAISGENDLMVFPQEVAAWDPDYIRDWDGEPGYSIANNDGLGTLHAEKGAYLQIYCDIKTSSTFGDDSTYSESDTSMSLDPDYCIFVPISSKDNSGEEVWLAGNIVTYTLTFGAGYDKEGNKNDDVEEDETPVSVVVTASLNGWDNGGDYDVEF